MSEELKQMLKDWAVKYNDPVYFATDPISFPRAFMLQGAELQDIEVAALFAAHLAWGRREMIVRDCKRLFDHMDNQPYKYVMSGCYRDDPTSIHRTIKWSEIASICVALKSFYEHNSSLEALSAEQLRVQILGSKPDRWAANKKIHMMRRWMVRNDGKVDLGLWKNTSPADLIIPLDVHVYTQAFKLGLTDRKVKDLRTAIQITDAFREIFPDDPAQGDFALFGYGIDNA